jgi:hypothetical protein
METGVWHYTYYSYEIGGRGYIGKRTSRVPPQDDPYLGSFSDKTFQPTHKIVIATYDSAEDAYRAETALQILFTVHKAEHFANRVIYPAGRFGPRPKLENQDRMSDPESMKKCALELLDREALTPQSEFDAWRPIIDSINRERKDLIAKDKIDGMDTIYLLKSPYGVTYPVSDLESFCRAPHMDLDAIRRIVLGEIKSWNGWERGESCYPWNN